MTTDPFTVGDALRRKRETRTDMSARALSLKAGLSESYVGKIESGQMEPSLRAFARIAATLDLNAHEISMIIAKEAERGA